MKKITLAALLLTCSLFATACSSNELQTQKSTYETSSKIDSKSTYSNEYFSFDYDKNLFVVSLPADGESTHVINCPSMPKEPEGAHNTVMGIVTTPCDISILSSEEDVKFYLTDIVKNLCQGLFELKNNETIISENTEYSNFSAEHVMEISDGSKCYVKALNCNTYISIVVLRTCEYSNEYNNDFVDIYNSAKTTFGNYDFSLQAKETREDFFSNIVKEDYYNNYHSGKYDVIYNMVISYIDEHNPDETDNAYKLKSILEPVMEVWDDVVVSYDSFDDYATFHCDGIQNISKDVHFVPYATTNERDIFISSGFFKNNWLFTDRIKIKTQDDYIELSSFRNDVRDVLSNGTIKEVYTYTFDDKDITNFNSINTHTIRFINDNDDKKLDFSLTKQEEYAFDVISRFWNVRNQLDNLAFHYYENLDK